MDRGGTMMRYRFDSFEQVARHLHLVNNAALLFVRDQKRLPTPFGRVLLALDIRASGQQTVVRGEVVARAEGGLPGAWLQLSDLRLARRLREAGGFAARREGRVSGDQLLQLRSDAGHQLVVQLLDIGAGGMRVRAGGLRKGDDYRVRLLGLPALKADLGLARVVRADAAEAGLRFDVPGDQQVLNYVKSLQEAWSRAVEIDHVPDCCARGAPIEPSLPKVRNTSRL